MYTFETLPFVQTSPLKTEYGVSGGCRFHQEVPIEVVSGQRHDFRNEVVKFNDLTFMATALQYHDDNLIMIYYTNCNLETILLVCSFCS